MKSVKGIVINELGIHARPSSLIAQEASKYNVEFTILFKGRNANLKSILNMTSLAMKKDNEFILEAKGVDEVNALKKMVSFLESNKFIKVI
ncbi:HPr family phosphocarrier protein [Spiroplasma endosymbiont of Othius punctulatus]|uniref:HPr family phosphocarrier protein n=1 Tax=Spiroplasma endosymbiont of Othius punctulatus TaxID=3066289 RepID=UPI0030CDBD15